MGEAGKTELWPCSFNETKFRRLAADGFCGFIQCVAAPSSRRRAVRRLRQQLGAWGAAWIQLRFLQVTRGALCKFLGPFVIFFFFWTFL